MNQIKHRRTWRGFAGLVAVALLLSGCGLLGASNEPTEVTIDAPAEGSDVKVGQSIVIKGVAKGGAIGRVDIQVDGQLYAQQDSGTPEGLAELSIEAPWTPTSAGQHTVVISAIAPKADKAAEDRVLSRSQTRIVNAQAAAVPPTPTAPAPPTPVPTAAPAATAAPGAGAGDGGAAPSTGSADAPSLSVTNEFVNVRKGPGVGYDKLGELKQNEKVPVRGRTSDGAWYQVAFNNGVGWVIADFVAPNAAAKSVAVAEAPPPPAAPVQPAVPAAPVAPAANPVLVPLVPPAAPAAPVAPPVAAQPTTGGKNILRINQNPVPAGTTVVATWSIPNFTSGDFDKGDGAGFKGPIAGTMQVNVENVTGQRTITVRWKDSGGAEQTDSLTIFIAGQAVAAATAVPNTQNCDASSPFWKAGANAAYTFCSSRDMEYDTAGINSVQSFNAGEDRSLTLSWNIFGVAGLYFNIEGNGTHCNGAAGSSAISRPVSGQDRSTFNIKDLQSGGYKLRMRVIKRDGGEVSYNEKFICISGGGGGGGGTSPTATPNSGGGGSNPTPAP
jgi:hypothetical protein